jgi:hypothetical protein
LLRHLARIDSHRKDVAMNDNTRSKPETPEPATLQGDAPWAPNDDEPESQREIRTWKGTTPPGLRFTQPFPLPWRQPNLSQ